MAEAMRTDLFDIDCSFCIAGPAAFVDTLRDEAQPPVSRRARFTATCSHEQLWLVRTARRRCRTVWLARCLRYQVLG